MNAEQIAERCGGARRAGAGWLCRCPAHDDRTPSLSVRDIDRKTLLHCFGGCSYLAVVAALKRIGVHVHARS